MVTGWSAGKLALCLVLTVTLEFVSAQPLIANTPGGVRTVGDVSPGVEPLTLHQGTTVDGFSQSALLPEQDDTLELELMSGELVYENRPANLDAAAEEDPQALLSVMLGRYQLTAAGHGNSSNISLNHHENFHQSASNNQGIRSHNSSSSSSNTSKSSNTATNDATSSSDSYSDNSGATNVPINNHPNAAANQLSASSSAVAQPSAASDNRHFGSSAVIEQVSLSTIKLRPVAADSLSSKMASYEEAAAWQESLQCSLQTATAEATNMPVERVQTEMTFTLHLGLELLEPSSQNATAAAATAVLNHIKALAAPNAVQVGVSLVRLGSKLDGTDTSGRILVQQGSKHSVTAATAVAEANPTMQGIQAASVGTPKAVLVMLSVYSSHPHSLANLLTTIGTMRIECPEMFAAGPSRLNDSSCGQALLKSYVVGSSQAAQAPAMQVDTQFANSSTSLQQTAQNSSNGNTVTDAMSQTMHQPKQSLPNFVIVRQYPKVDMLITQIVGFTAADGPSDTLPADVLRRLSQWVSSDSLARLLTDSGLVIAQAGVSKLLDLRVASGYSANTNTAVASPELLPEAGAVPVATAARAGSLATNATNAAPNLEPGAESEVERAVSGLVAGVAAAAVFAVIVIAAVALMIIRMRAKVAQARANARHTTHSKHRKEAKGKGLTSRYLPTSMPLDLNQSQQQTAAGSMLAGRTGMSLQMPLISPLATAAASRLRILTVPTAAVESLSPTHQTLSTASRHSLVMLSPSGMGAGGLVALSPDGLRDSQALIRGDSVTSAVRFDLQEAEEADGTENSSEFGTASSTGNCQQGQQQQHRQQQHFVLPALWRLLPGPTVQLQRLSSPTLADRPWRNQPIQQLACLMDDSLLLTSAEAPCLGTRPGSSVTAAANVSSGGNSNVAQSVTTLPAAVANSNFVFAGLSTTSSPEADTSPCRLFSRQLTGNELAAAAATPQGLITGAPPGTSSTGCAASSSHITIPAQAVASSSGGDSSSRLAQLHNQQHIPQDGTSNVSQHYGSICLWSGAGGTAAIAFADVLQAAQQEEEWAQQRQQQQQREYYQQHYQMQRPLPKTLLSPFQQMANMPSELSG